MNPTALLPRRPSQRRHVARWATALLALGAIGCSESPPPVTYEPKPPGLEAEPRWLTFKCTKPGCDTTLDVVVRQVGERRLAIKRVVLSDPERTDFAIQSDLQAPAIIENEFKVSVRYAPQGSSDAREVKLLVTYADGSPDEGENRIPPGELEVPLLRRLVGEPVLVATPSRLVFGHVEPGQSATLPLTIANAGSGNTSLAIAAIESDSPLIQAPTIPTTGFAPGESTEIQIAYAPTAEAFTEAHLLVRAVDDVVPPVEVVAVGTSLPRPSIAVSPEAGIDFGRVARGSPAQASIEVVNRGGTDLEISSAQVRGSADLSVALPGGSSSLTLAPLESATLTVSLSAETAGELDATLVLATNAPGAAAFEVPIVGLVTEPRALAIPAELDFGKVPRGWVVVEPITIQNSGWGELEVRGLTLVLGSSSLFSLQSVPELPARLERDQKLAVEIQFSAETIANLSGTLSVESNDPVTPFLEVPIRAEATSCEDGCPLDHATPSCVGGECSVQSCDTGWYDTDGDPANGCECTELGSDPGSSCQAAYYMGEFKDTSPSSATFRGMLPREDDIDVVTFFGEDAFGFGGSYNVQITLDSPDPTIKLCVYWHSTDSHLGECYLENESCPDDRYFQRGNTSGDETADYTVKIFRLANAAPTCIPYSLVVSNG